MEAETRNEEGSEDLSNSVDNSVDFNSIDSPLPNLEDSQESTTNDRNGTPILRPTFKSVLQAKKRLQAFSSNKQLQLNCSPKKVGEEGDKTTPKKVKKEMYPEEKLKNTIKEIEDLKMKQNRSTDFELIDQINKINMEIEKTTVFSLSKQRSESRERDNKFRKVEVKSRNYRRSAVKSPTPEPAVKPATEPKKEVWAKTWADLNKGLSLKKLELSKSKLDSSEFYKFFTFASPSMQTGEFRFKKDKAPVPFKYIRQTKATPHIFYNVNTAVIKDTHITRKQLYDLIPNPRKEFMENMFKEHSKLAPYNGKLETRKWFPKSWRKVDQAEGKLLENSVGLLFLQGYSDEEETEVVDQVKSAVEEVKERHTPPLKGAVDADGTDTVNKMVEEPEAKKHKTEDDEKLHKKASKLDDDVVIKKKKKRKSKHDDIEKTRKKKKKHKVKKAKEKKKKGSKRSKLEVDRQRIIEGLKEEIEKVEKAQSKKRDDDLGGKKRRRRSRSESAEGKRRKGKKSRRKRSESNEDYLESRTPLLDNSKILFKDASRLGLPGGSPDSEAYNSQWESEDDCPIPSKDATRSWESDEEVFGRYNDKAQKPILKEDLEIPLDLIKTIKPKIEKQPVEQIEETVQSSKLEESFEIPLEIKSVKPITEESLELPLEIKPRKSRSSRWDKTKQGAEPEAVATDEVVEPEPVLPEFCTTSEVNQPELSIKTVLPVPELCTKAEIPKPVVPELSKELCKSPPSELCKPSPSKLCKSPPSVLCKPSPSKLCKSPLPEACKPPLINVSEEIRRLELEKLKVQQLELQFQNLEENTKRAFQKYDESLRNYKQAKSAKQQDDKYPVLEVDLNKVKVEDANITSSTDFDIAGPNPLEDEYAEFMKAVAPSKKDKYSSSSEDSSADDSGSEDSDSNDSVPTTPVKIKEETVEPEEVVPTSTPVAVPRPVPSPKQLDNLPKPLISLNMPQLIALSPLVVPNHVLSETTQPEAVQTEETSPVKKPVNFAFPSKKLIANNSLDFGDESEEEPVKEDGTTEKLVETVVQTDKQEVQLDKKEVEQRRDRSRSPVRRRRSRSPRRRYGSPMRRGRDSPDRRRGSYGGRRSPGRGRPSPGSRRGLSPGARRASSPGGRRPPSPGARRPPSPGGRRPPSPGSRRPPSPGSRRPPSPGSRRPPSPGSRRPPSPGSRRPPSPGSRRSSPSGSRRTMSPNRRPMSPSGRRFSSPGRRPLSPGSRRPASPSRAGSRRRRSPSPRRHRRSPSPRQRRRSISPKMRPSSPKRRKSSPLRKSPVIQNSPLEGLKKSVADSTISDDLLPQPNLMEDYTESPLTRFYDKTMTRNVDSPKRMPLDIRINQVLGLEKNEAPVNPYEIYQHPPQQQHYNQYMPPYGYPPNPSQQQQISPSLMQHQQIPPVVKTTPTNKVVQVGNMLQIVPREDVTPTLDKPPTTILQVGNMLQIVPQNISPPKTGPPVQIEEPTTSTDPPPPEKPSIDDVMKQKIAERRAEREKRRAEREKRRKEKEKRRKEKEKEKQLKLKLKTESMIKKALLQEDLEEDEDAQDDVAVPLQWPPMPLPVHHIAKEAGKSILRGGGGSGKRKSVHFADGVRPGEGTSPSGGEELSSPPPANKKLPKEKRYKKTKVPKKTKKKKIKVKVIKRPQEDSDEEDNLPPPSPPPGSPPPHVFPPRVKTHTVNNLHASLSNILPQNMSLPVQNIQNTPPGYQSMYRPPPPPGPMGVPMSMPPPVNRQSLPMHPPIHASPHQIHHSYGQPPPPPIGQINLFNAPRPPPGGSPWT